MQVLSLSPTGPEFSRIIPGLMRLKEWGMSAAELRGWIEALLDMGISTFDHANIYGGYSNEERFGAALAGDSSLRHKMQLISKTGIELLSEQRPDTTIKHYDTSSTSIIAEAERSLRLLQTDYLDVLLVHRPDPLMDADDIAHAFNRLVREGKVRYVGVSNFSPSQFSLLQSRLDMPLVSNQVEASVLHLDPFYDGTFDQAQQLRRAPMVWSPLAGGAIFRGDDERSARVKVALQRVGDELGGKPLDQIALAWLLQHPVKMLPVVGTGKLERIQSAAVALEITMSRQQWFSILEASQGHEVP